MAALMNILVVAEHNNASIKGATLNTVTAALACGGEVHVLVAATTPAPPPPPPRRSPASPRCCMPMLSV